MSINGSTFVINRTCVRLQGEGRDLANRMHNLEAKLMEIDSSASASRYVPPLISSILP